MSTLISIPISLAALIVSVWSLAVSYFFRRRSFRPVVTAAVTTHSGGNEAITYNLVVQNSGAIPAKNIRIRLAEGAESALASAFGRDASAENKQRWLACFDETILLLHSNDRTSCSFGTTNKDDGGFWKYKAMIPITITYESFFGTPYTNEPQNIQIADSDSFTGYWWGPNK